MLLTRNVGIIKRLYRDSGKETGNQYLGIRVLVACVAIKELI